MAHPIALHSANKYDCLRLLMSFDTDWVCAHTTYYWLQCMFKGRNILHTALSVCNGTLWCVLYSQQIQHLFTTSVGLLIKLAALLFWAWQHVGVNSIGMLLQQEQGLVEVHHRAAWSTGQGNSQHGCHCSLAVWCKIPQVHQRPAAGGCTLLPPSYNLNICRRSQYPQNRYFMLLD